MFELQIDHAKEMIHRLERCEQEGIDNVPPSIAVSTEEHSAWYAGVDRLIVSIFGPSSKETERWRELFGRRGEMFYSYGIQYPSRDTNLPVHISHLQASITLLREFETAYVTQRQNRNNAAERPSKPPDSLQKALLEQLWSSKSWLRNIALMVAGVGALIFVLWVSFPDTVKQKIIDRLFSR